jgi:hypothetical protein
MHPALTAHTDTSPDAALQKPEDGLMWRAASPLDALLHRPPARQETAAIGALPSVVLGELVALLDALGTPLVTFGGRAGTAPVPARSTVELAGEHVGATVTLVFEHGDPTRPIVTGVLRQAGSLYREAPEHVSLEADGARLVVQARDKLVLQCGQASITLTRAGKVLIQGTYVSSRSAGLNRIAGGSVQLN